MHLCLLPSSIPVFLVRLHCSHPHIHTHCLVVLCLGVVLSWSWSCVFCTSQSVPALVHCTRLIAIPAATYDACTNVSLLLIDTPLLSTVEPYSVFVSIVRCSHYTPDCALLPGAYSVHAIIHKHCRISSLCRYSVLLDHNSRPFFCPCYGSLTTYSVLRKNTATLNIKHTPYDISIHPTTPYSVRHPTTSTKLSVEMSFKDET